MSLNFEGWTEFSPREPALARTAANPAQKMHRLEQELLAAYEANHQQGELWSLADFRDADAATRPEIRKELRAYSRYEYQNNPFVTRVVEVFIHDLLGSPGPVINVESGVPELDRLLAELWLRYCRRVNLWAKILTALRARVVDGEGFLLKNPSNKALPRFRYAPWPVEADRIAAPFTEWDHLQHYVDGVQLDPVTKEPVLYHLLTTHPGNEYYDASPGGWDKIDIPAERMIHLFRQLRPEQHRGIPDATPVLPLSGLFRKFLNGSINKEALQAAFAFVIKSMAAGEDDNAQTGDDDGELWKRLSFPKRQGLGMILPEGMDIQQLQAGTQSQSVKDLQLVFGVLYATLHSMPVGRVTGQYATSSYAPIRAELKPYQNRLDRDREDLLSPALSTCFEWFLQEAQRLPEVRLLLDQHPEADPTQHSWNFAEPELVVDPSREGEGRRKDMAAGLTLRSDNIPDDELLRRDIKAAREFGHTGTDEEVVIAYRQDCRAAVFGLQPKQGPEAGGQGSEQPPEDAPDDTADDAPDGRLIASAFP